MLNGIPHELPERFKDSVGDRPGRASMAGEEGFLQSVQAEAFQLPILGLRKSIRIQTEDIPRFELLAGVLENGLGEDPQRPAFRVHPPDRS